MIKSLKINHSLIFLKVFNVLLQYDLSIQENMIQ